VSYLRIQSLGKRYGGVVALDGVSLEIAGAGIYGLIGPNGAGKTTLFDCLAGTTEPDQGRVWLQGHDVTGWPAHRMARLGVARTFQECRILPEETCLNNVLFAAQPQGLGGNLVQMFTRRPGHRVAALDEAMRLLHLVRLQDHAHAPAADLSFGQRRLLEIVSTFMAQPEMLLLDEPASGVNPSLLQVLGDFVKTMMAERPRVMLLVEHNMSFVMDMAQDIIVMHQGQLLERGTPAQVQASAKVVEAYLG
jgi:ABC-type branched-subunit amino acid transport system ATPase component